MIESRVVNIPQLVPCNIEYYLLKVTDAILDDRETYAIDHMFFNTPVEALKYWDTVNKNYQINSICIMERITPITAISNGTLAKDVLNTNKESM